MLILKQLVEILEQPIRMLKNEHSVILRWKYVSRMGPRRNGRFIMILCSGSIFSLINTSDLYTSVGSTMTGGGTIPKMSMAVFKDAQHRWVSVFSDTDWKNWAANPSFFLSTYVLFKQHFTKTVDFSRIWTHFYKSKHTDR